MENNNLNEEKNNNIDNASSCGSAEETKTAEPTSPTKKKKKKIIILSIVFTLLVALLAVILFVVLYKPNNGSKQPPVFDTNNLHGTVNPDIYELPEGEEPLPTETTSSDVTTAIPETTETPEEPKDPSTLPKSEQSIYNFLLVGKDRVALNTDVIMLINFNVSTKKISVLQIPRDTYIQLGYYNGKINGLFAYYYVTNKNDTIVALRKFADDLEKNLCIKIHNVAHIDLDGVRAVVDILGGVEVNVPSAFTYYSKNQKRSVTVYPGPYMLDGEAAEQFIRHRSSYLQADIGRIDAQKVFLSGVLKKVKSDFNILTISKLVSEGFKYLTTDISLADAVFFAKSLLGIDMSDIKFMSMMGSGHYSYLVGSIYVMSRKNMREMIDTYFNIYDFPITDSIFDPNIVFSSKTIIPEIHKYYIRQDFVTGQPYDADSINDNSISIPHV